MSGMEIVFGIFVAVYLGLWIADLWSAPTPEAQRKIVTDFAETVVVACIFATIVWWAT